MLCKQEQNLSTPLFLRQDFFCAFCRFPWQLAMTIRMNSTHTAIFLEGRLAFRPSRALVSSLEIHGF